jgi:hypothetical protein
MIVLNPHFVWIGYDNFIWILDDSDSLILYEFQ